MGSVVTKVQGKANNQQAVIPPGAAQPQKVEDEDEPDEWDKRIFSTGCADENTKLTDCYYEKKDWRLCKKEMEIFRQCWKVHGNDRRTGTKDA